MIGGKREQDQRDQRRQAGSTVRAEVAPNRSGPSAKQEQCGIHRDRAADVGDVDRCKPTLADVTQPRRERQSDQRSR